MISKHQIKKLFFISKSKLKRTDIKDLEYVIFECTSKVHKCVIKGELTRGALNSYPIEQKTLIKKTKLFQKQSKDRKVCNRCSF